jgi:hypothetical protein
VLESRAFSELSRAQFLFRDKAKGKSFGGERGKVENFDGEMSKGEEAPDGIDGGEFVGV